MLFEGQAGEALERSGFLSYRFPVEVKVSRVCLVTFLSTYSFVDSIRLQTHIPPGRMFEKYRYDNLELRHPRCVCNTKVQCKEVKNITVYYL